MHPEPIFVGQAVHPRHLVTERHVDRPGEPRDGPSIASLDPDVRAGEDPSLVAVPQRDGVKGAPLVVLEVVVYPETEQGDRLLRQVADLVVSCSRAPLSSSDRATPRTPRPAVRLGSTRLELGSNAVVATPGPAAAAVMGFDGDVAPLIRFPPRSSGMPQRRGRRRSTEGDDGRRR